METGKEVDLHDTVHNTTEAPNTRVIVSSSGSRRGRSNDRSMKDDDGGGGSSDGSSDGRSLLLIITVSHAPNVGLSDGAAVGDGRGRTLGAGGRGWSCHLAV